MASTSSSDPGLKSEAVISNDQLGVYRGLKKAKKERGCTAKERISKMPPCTAGKRSSIYRGVTRHRWTGRYEAHLWDKSTWNQNQNKKGKQVYLGAYDDEEAAARAYDLAALKYWGPGTLINFPVSDYTRDLEEMQSVSREDYLASLRRKSSGFSRGTSKYRGLSRWDSSVGRIATPEYFSSIDHGDDGVTESDLLGSYCIDRKIDLTSYIKWWGINKTRQTDSSSKSTEETKYGCAEDIDGELKRSDWAIETTSPYQMPRLGISPKEKTHKTALSILSQSPAYKNLQEKAFKRKEKNTDKDEDANKTLLNRMESSKAVGKSISHDGGTEGLGAELGSTGPLSLQRSVNPLTSAPLLTNYNTIDPSSDPILWTHIIPDLPAELSHNSEVIKTEASSTYPFFWPEEGYLSEVAFTRSMP